MVETKFAVSTGQLGAAIRSLSRSSTTATDVAKIWLEILQRFFPDARGFERTPVHLTHDQVLIQVHQDRDLDGDVIVDCDAKRPFLVIDCRPRTPIGDNNDGVSEISSPEDRDDMSFSVGVIACGPQAVFLKEVALSQVAQDKWSLHGMPMGSANLIKATGRDTTEEWLRKVRDTCSGLSGTS